MEGIDLNKAVEETQALLDAQYSMVMGDEEYEVLVHQRDLKAQQMREKHHKANALGLLKEAQAKLNQLANYIDNHY